MEVISLTTVVKQALLLVLMLSAPAVVAVSVVGLIIAFLQAVTQIQDQTLSFGIKLVVAVAAIALTSSWLGGELYNFADQLFAAVANIR